MCSHSVENLHDAIQMAMIVVYVLEMTVKKSCMANVDRLSIAGLVKSLVDSAWKRIHGESRNRTQVFRSRGRRLTLG